MKYFLPSLFCIVSLAFFSKPVCSKDFIDLKDFPTWFKEAMAKEVEVKSTSKLNIDELKINEDVLGKLKLEEKAENFWYFTIDIGTASPVECYAFTSYDGAATSFHAIIEATLPGVEKLNNKKLSGRYNYSLETGVIGETPYLLLDTLYHLGEGNNKVAGLLKGYSAETKNTLQICIHNELGYRDTFRTVFTSFLSAFEKTNDDSSFFENIYQLKLNDMDVGYARETFIIDQDGDIETKQEMAMMVPVDANSVAHSDSLNLEWGNTDGALINAYTYTIENGAMTQEFSISNAEGEWSVSGQMQGKAVESKLEHKEWLLSTFGSYLAVANILSTEALEANYAMWMPDADPVSATSISVKELTENKDANVSVDMGPIKMDYLAETDGTFEFASLEQNGLPLKLIKLHAKGSPILD